ncbi:hypothetical protein [Sphaerisporangium sp. NPDC051011]|uniref:hypothetical protein n=1 Tax=Sphaerisporangium sp. NPDC051011 TaxID=3155792 RepID=UPI0033F8A6EC
MQMIQRTVRCYRVEYVGCAWTLPADLIGKARVASILAAAREWGLPITLTVKTRAETVRACLWCRARPRAWAWDGEGRFERIECDHPQCVAARRAAGDGEIAPPSYVAARSVLRRSRRAASPAARPLTAILSPDRPPPLPITPDRRNEEVTAVISESPNRLVPASHVKPGVWVRPPAPSPLAYQLGDQRVLCAGGCLPHDRAQEMADACEHVGDVQPWTVHLAVDDEDLRCDGCGAVLAQAPRLPDDEEPAAG